VVYLDCRKHWRT